MVVSVWWCGLYIAGSMGVNLLPWL